MRQKFTIGAVVIAVAAAAGCTLSQTQAPALTGPSGFATSVTVSANPDTIALGQSVTVFGQKSMIIASVLDANGQPKPNQLLRFETLVNGKPSNCGQLSLSSVTTGSDGRALTEFVAPGTPPNCPNFNSDGTVTIRATPVGKDFVATASTASSVNLFMALPTFGASVGPFTVSFSISPDPGKPAPAVVTFSDTGSVSPGHTITSYRWNWSDGATKNGATVTHDFLTVGTYTVTLTVTDDILQTSFKTGLVTIAN